MIHGKVHSVLLAFSWILRSNIFTGWYFELRRQCYFSETVNILLLLMLGEKWKTVQNQTAVCWNQTQLSRFSRGGGGCLKDFAGVNWPQKWCRFSTSALQSEELHAEEGRVRVPVVNSWKRSQSLQRFPAAPQWGRRVFAGAWGLVWGEWILHQSCWRPAALEWPAGTEVSPFWPGEHPSPFPVSTQQEPSHSKFPEAGLWSLLR